MVSTGLRLDIGSWKMMAISCPRMRAIRSSSRRARSTAPSELLNQSSPASICAPVRPNRRMIDRPVTDLPEPDSPTIASISLAPTLKLTPSTALSVPSGVVKLVFRPRTSMIASRAPSAVGFSQSHSA